ncbi:MAG: helix-turn-helix domain-containing protein [Acidobacteriia bacterium]|nr:helix-turn-helix domain-containing protein [Terriglobia bacterium]
MNGQQNIGVLIREARELSGTTLTQFAALLRVNPAAISHLERDYGIGSNTLIVRALQLATRLLGAKYNSPFEDKWTFLACEEQLRTLLVFCRVGDLEASIQSLPPSVGA